MIDKKLRIIKLTLIKPIEYVLLVSALLSVIYFILYSRPKKTIGDLNPSEFNLNWEEINIHNKIKLNGWFIQNKNSNTALILLHGWPADKSDILPFTHFLAKDHSLLYLDMRGLGKSDGYVCASQKEVTDIKKWIEVLKNKGIKKIGIFGYSYGAFVAIRSLYSLDELDFAIADSPFNSIKHIMNYILSNYNVLKYPLMFFLDIEYILFCGERMNNFEIDKKIDKIKKPLLIICGSKDEICYNENLINYSKINSKVEVKIFEDLKHGETLLNKKFKQVVNEFIKRSLK